MPLAPGRLGEQGRQEHCHRGQQQSPGQTGGRPQGLIRTQALPPAAGPQQPDTGESGQSDRQRSRRRHRSTSSQAPVPVSCASRGRRSPAMAFPRLGPVRARLPAWRGRARRAGPGAGTSSHPIRSQSSDASRRGRVLRHRRRAAGAQLSPSGAQRCGKPDADRVPPGPDHRSDVVSQSPPTARSRPRAFGACGSGCGGTGSCSITS